MGLFDSLKRQAINAIKTNGNKIGKEIGDNVKNAVKNAANKSITIDFPGIPESYEEFVSLPEAKMETPFETAAMTVLAFCVYPKDKDLSIKMLNFLRGPRPLSGMDISFIRDRFMDGRDYVPRSYFEGATPENDYTPNVPLKIVIGDNPYSYENGGYAKLLVRSGGADSLREIVLREAKDGKWYLWDQFILADIRQPESADPWA
ncbi:MAG: hypothetical protein IKL57_08740 [Oscillospiraceae bacterium]|nr:hypothetical protein [Oscillospiraceae bacterium]MBR3611525.1 hypothetical protein [Oscillospiraceae bacterium]MBR3953110.1 hypothetical protein [Oscillospiraceae bacterium]